MLVPAPAPCEAHYLLPRSLAEPNFFEVPRRCSCLGQPAAKRHRGGLAAPSQPPGAPIRIDRVHRASASATMPVTGAAASLHGGGRCMAGYPVPVGNSCLLHVPVL